MFHHYVLTWNRRMQIAIASKFNVNFTLDEVFNLPTTIRINHNLPMLGEKAMGIARIAYEKKFIKIEK